MTNKELTKAVQVKDDKMEVASKKGARLGNMSAFLKAFRKQKEPMSVFWAKWSKKIIELEKRELAKIGGKDLKVGEKEAK